MSYEDFNKLLILILIVGFLVIIALEFLFPPFGARRKFGAWSRHAAKNLSMWLVNTTILRFTYGALPLLAAIWAENLGVGVFNMLPMPGWLAILLGVVVIDFFDYLLHRILHNVRPLWLLHAVHHSDQELDVTTNLRAHPVQTLVIVGWKLLVTLGMGLSMWALLVRELFVIPVAQLHHANIHWPERLDRSLRWLIVTPAMHRLHHSPEIAQTNSNYGELFSVWDRIFGTYRFEGSVVRGPFGLKSLAAPGWHSVWGMIKTPFAARKIRQL